VQTAGDGTFSLETLGSAPEGMLTLFATPAPDSHSGILSAPVQITPNSNDLGIFSAPDKVLVSGQVLTPEGTAAVGVQVTAVPVASGEEDPAHPLPSEGAEAVTDAQGNFSFALDPAAYRLDFVPGQSLPRVSRFLEVAAASQTVGSVPPLTPFTLSRGRSATGHVEVLSADGGTPDVAPLARVRFYRRVMNGKQASSILLDQAYADENGDFTVLLPAASR
jgi:hypothetical protein